MVQCSIDDEYDDEYATGWPLSKVNFKPKSKYSTPLDKILKEI